ncbi:MAG: DNA primase, partial [Chromatiales bacterium]|nr:DNA primase [Chromatiales bacterium]
MSGRIPQAFIDELTARVDIVDVIDGYVSLRKAGREYVARCPFHEERSPSFTVSPEKQFYHCFGCGAHGTAIGFLMEYARLDFVEAVRELAGRVGMVVPQTGDVVTPRADETDLYGVLEEAAGWFRRQLREHPRGREEAIGYLKARGLGGESAATFGLGYAPPGWDNLLK